MVARSRGYADERQLLRAGGGSDDRQRAIAPGHPERIRAAGHGLIDQAPQVPAAAELDDLDALLERALGDPRTRGGAPTRPRVDEEHRRARRIGRFPAGPPRRRHARVTALVSPC
jgi:hypothetical protein